MNHAIRLKCGSDIKKSIMDYAKKRNIKAGVVVSGVGCLSHIHIRLAGAKDYINQEDDYEIVSITGTIGLDDVHIHISASDKNGNTIGGHLKDGSIVNTTVELVIMELDNYIFTREFDDETGYNELMIRER